MYTAVESGPQTPAYKHLRFTEKHFDLNEAQKKRTRSWVVAVAWLRSGDVLRKANPRKDSPETMVACGTRKVQ